MLCTACQTDGNEAAALECLSEASSPSPSLSSGWQNLTTTFSAFIDTSSPDPNGKN